MYGIRKVSYIIQVRSILDHLSVVYVPMHRIDPAVKVGQSDYFQIPATIDADKCDRSKGVPHMPPAKGFKVVSGHRNKSYHFPNTVRMRLAEKFLGVFDAPRFIDDLGDLGDVDFTEYGNGEFIYVQATIDHLKNPDEIFTVDSISYFNSKALGKNIRQTKWHHPRPVDEMLDGLRKTHEIDYTHRNAKGLLACDLIPAPEIKPETIDEFGEHY